MTLNNLKYIKLASFFPYLTFLLLLIFFISVKFTISPIYIFSILLFFIFSKFSGTLMGMELYRRFAELPVPKENFLNWKNNKDAGICFIDPEKDAFWFCGTQTDFSVHIISMQDIGSDELNDRIIYTDKNTHIEYIAYKHSK